MNCSILVNQLIVVGLRKNYIVNFHPGVNIIYGDSATGKSSVLNLIDYLLGAKEFSSYPEIEAAGRYAALDLMLNDTRYTIKRDLFDPSALIEVYQCSFENITQYPYAKYVPGFKYTLKYEGIEIFPEFLFNALNIANIKLKSSPSKDDSSYSRLSFRDLMKYCYVDQDDLGSKRFLDRGNYALEARNAQVFKYIYNALDSQISDIQQEISDKTRSMSTISTQYTNVSEFLRESDFGSMQGIDEQILQIDGKLLDIKRYLSEINNRISVDNDAYRAAKAG